ncbi:MAG: GntR family transcriptional regulator [Colwellia sp.]|nr:GntR family transcriptional regulator [Colwellia sp.]
MEIEIDVNDDTPIFHQLINQVKGSVMSGVLTTGVSLPSIRQLANELGVNQNTVAKAYKMLERDSIIVARGYRGTFIHENAKENCQVNLNDKGLNIMKESIVNMRALGLTDSEIRIAFSSLMKQSN